jgi:transposase InsO family protein
MRIFNKLRGTSGFLHVANRGIRFRYMISTEAKKRAHILTFWKKYGYDATYEAYAVKERTLFDWQRKLKKRHGKLESLNNGSRAPKQARRRRWDYRIVEEITRLRDAHPNLGEKKLYPLLAAYCATHALICPKPATIGNIMKDKGGMRTVPQRITGTGRIVTARRVNVLRKPKDVRIDNPGALVALDTIVVIIHGKRYYIVTVEDIYSRFAFAWATTSHASRAAEEFFRMWQAVFPYATTFVLTDNGSEFKKHFAARLLELQITHYHTYPRTPKMNAHVERFNRTIQEEFVDFHKNLLFNLEVFNGKLMDWLLFYNTKRVHHAFKNKLSPVQYLLQYEANLPADCESTLGYTSA